MGADGQMQALLGNYLLKSKITNVSQKQNIKMILKY